MSDEQTDRKLMIGCPAHQSGPWFWGPFVGAIVLMLIGLGLSFTSYLLLFQITVLLAVVVLGGAFFHFGCRGANKMFGYRSKDFDRYRHDHEEH